jgi:hypothetical protein
MLAHQLFTSGSYASLGPLDSVGSQVLAISLAIESISARGRQIRQSAVRRTSQGARITMSVSRRGELTERLQGPQP